MPVPPAYPAVSPFKARWPLPALCKVQPGQADTICGVNNIKFMPYSQTSLSDILVQIPGDMHSSLPCKFNTVMPVISHFQLLALGNMSFFCMGGMILQCQGMREVILVLLDCTLTSSNKQKLTAMSCGLWRCLHILPITS